MRATAPCVLVNFIQWKMENKLQEQCIVSSTTMKRSSSMNSVFHNLDLHDALDWYDDYMCRMDGVDPESYRTIFHPENTEFHLICDVDTEFSWYLIDKKSGKCGIPYVPVGATCPICLEGITRRKDAFFTDCGHGFHRQCIGAWTCKSGDPFCPVCRYSVGYLDWTHVHPMTVHEMSPELLQVRMCFGSCYQESMHVLGSQRKHGCKNCSIWAYGGTRKVKHASRVVQANRYG